MQHHKHKIYGILICLVLALTLVVVAGCGDSKTTDTTAAGGTDTTAASGGSTDVGDLEELKVGALLSLDTVQGVEMKKWLELFAELKNNDGGWQIGGQAYKVKPMIYDVGVFDAEKTRSATEKAVMQDGVKYMVCNWGDVPGETISICEANDVLWMGMDFTDDSVAPELNYAIRAQGLFFAQGMFYYIIEDYMKQGAKTGLIVAPDSQQGKVGAQLVLTTAEMLGMEVVAPVFFSMDTTEFGPIATKIANANCDAVFFSFIPSDQVLNLLAAMKEAGYEGLVLPGELDSTTLADLVKRVGVDYVEGMQTGWYDPKGVETDAQTVKYIEAYEAKYGDWYSAGCFWVGPWFLFEDAVDATQSTDVNDLVAYLQDSKEGVRTLCGYSQLFARPEIGNTKTVDSAPGHYIGVIKGGEFEYLSTIACKDQYLSSVMIYGLQDLYTAYWQEFGDPVFPDQDSRIELSDVKGD